MPEDARECRFDIEVAAPAKINLALSVGAAMQEGPKRGYHPIASWFVCVSLCDHVRLRRLESIEASRHAIEWSSDAPRPTPIDWATEKDLAVRAHRLLEQRMARSLPVEMVVSKRIPVGGGLGGGSSDAAGALLALRRLFRLDITLSELQELSTALGADVAFFLDEHAERSQNTPRPALVTGFGERIERLACPPLASAILIFPDCSCPTGPVYQAFDRQPVQRLREAEVRGLVDLAARSGQVESARLFNDLAAPACEVQPRLGEALGTLSAALSPHPVHITGSGSTMFVLFMSEAGDAGRMAARREAESLRRRIETEMPRFWAMVVDLV